MGDREEKIKRIEQLLEIMKKNDLVELEIKDDDEKIVLKRAQPQQGPHVITAPIVGPSAVPSAGGAAPAPGQPASAEQQGAGLVDIKAPMVGTFYATPSPDSEPYVEVGSGVTSSTVVCIIEAMKVMNEIKAEVEGTIAEVCVKSGQAVEYGQVLFRVRPE